MLGSGGRELVGGYEEMGGRGVERLCVKEWGEGERLTFHKVHAA